MSVTVRAVCVLSALIIYCSGSAVTARADIPVFESAVAGPTGQPDCCLNGPIIGSDQYLGAGFHVSSPVHVTQVGGHMVSSTLGGRFPPAGSIFGVIVRLSGQGALPSGSPFDSGGVVASTLFNPGYPSVDPSPLTGGS